MTIIAIFTGDFKYNRSLIKTDTRTFNADMIIAGEWHRYDGLREYHDKGSRLKKKYPMSHKGDRQSMKKKINQTCVYVLVFLCRLPCYMMYKNTSFPL